MSEFAAILEVVGEVVKAVFEFSVDVICASAFAISTAAVWRAFEIFTMIGLVPQGRKFRQRMRWLCISSFLLTIADIFVIPMVALSLLSPLRWNQVKQSLETFSTNDEDAEEFSPNFKLRADLGYGFFCAILDAACWSIGIFALLSPLGRQTITCRMIPAILNATDQHEYAKKANRCSIWVASNGLSSLLDMAAWFAIVAVVFVPSVWRGTFDGIIEMRRNCPTAEEPGNGYRARYYIMKNLMKDWKRWFTRLRKHILFQLVHSAIDFTSAPFFLLALLSPLRNKPLRQAITTASTTALTIPPTPETTVVASASAAAPVTEVGKFDYAYDLPLRLQVLHLGFLAVADLFLLPMLLPLWCTRYRFRELWEVLPTDSAWGLHELYLVSSQTALLVVDFFLLLFPLPILLLSWLRWQPVRDALSRDHLFLEESSELYLLVVRQLGLLILDVLVSPFALLLLLTWYRSVPLRKIWGKKALWNHNALFHYAVMANLFVVLHDLLFLLPSFLLVAALAPHRLPLVGLILREGWAYHMRPQSHQNPVLHDSLHTRAEGAESVEGVETAAAAAGAHPDVTDNEPGTHRAAIFSSSSSTPPPTVPPVPAAPISPSFGNAAPAITGTGADAGNDGGNHKEIEKAAVSKIPSAPPLMTEQSLPDLPAESDGSVNALHMLDEERMDAQHRSEQLAILQSIQSHSALGKDSTLPEKNDVDRDGQKKLDKKQEQEQHADHIEIGIGALEAGNCTAELLAKDEQAPIVTWTQALEAVPIRQPAAGTTDWWAETADAGAASGSRAYEPIVLVNIFPSASSRIDLWEQAVQAVIDVPFLLLALIIVCTVWRAWELRHDCLRCWTSHQVVYERVLSAPLNTPYSRFYPRPKYPEYWYLSNNEMNNDFRKIVAFQLLLLFRDVLCLVPVALVAVSMYRLPQLLGSLWSKLSGSSLLSDPVLEVISCHCEFPERGGPSINFLLKRARNGHHGGAAVKTNVGTANASGDEGSINHQSLNETVADSCSAQLDLSHSSKIELHVVGNSLWQSASQIFGSVLVSVVKSYMPVHLQDQSSIGWSDFVAAWRTDNLLMSASAPLPSQSVLRRESESEPQPEFSPSAPLHQCDEASHSNHTTDADRDDTKEKLGAPHYCDKMPEESGHLGAASIAERIVTDDIAPEDKLRDSHCVAQEKEAPLMIAVEEEQGVSTSDVVVNITGEDAATGAARGNALGAGEEARRDYEAFSNQESCTRTEEVAGSVLEQCEQNNEEANSFPLWLRLDFGTTKRSTLVKKLKLMPPTDVLCLQLEGTVSWEHSVDATQETISIDYHDQQREKTLTTPPQAPHSKEERAVLLRVCPTIKEVLCVLEATSGMVPKSALHRTIPTVDQDPDAARDQNLVNSFCLVVLQVLLECAIDFLHFVLFWITLISPWRFMQLIVGLFEHEDKLPLRVAVKAVRTVCHLDQHLYEYRIRTAPLVNRALKAKIGTELRRPQGAVGSNPRFLRIDALYRPYLYSSPINWTEKEREFITQIEYESLRPYQKLRKQTIKLLSTYEACAELNQLVEQRVKLHDEIARLWFDRVAARTYPVVCQRRRYMQHLRGDLSGGSTTTPRFTRGLSHPSAATTTTVTANNTDAGAGAGAEGGDDGADYFDEQRFNAVSAIINQAHDEKAAALAKNRAQIDIALVEMEAAYKRKRSASAATGAASAAPATPGSNQQGSAAPPVKKKSWLKRARKSCGLLTRPLAASRSMILLSFLSAVLDVGFVMLFGLLIISLARLLPLVTELFEKRAFSVTRYTTRVILIKHTKQLGRDLLNIGKFLLFSTVVVVTVAGIPEYMADLPGRLSSYSTAAKCAQHHAKKFMLRILEIITLVFTFRTYRVLMKSVLYCLLVPGACLAEANPIRGLDTASRFAVGLLTWTGLLIGAIFVSRTASLAGDSDGATSAWAANNALLAIAAGLLVTLLVASASVVSRSHYTSPDGRAWKAPRLTWSHILAVIGAPMESIQLSAVVMFFFWGSSSGRVRSLGDDNFSSFLLLWGDKAGGGDAGFRISVSIAACAVVLWGLLVSVPLAVGGNEPHRRCEKVLAFKTAPLYELCMVCISRLFTVWIIVTLMRPMSCIRGDSSAIGASSSGADNDSNVLTTEDAMMCGGEGYWAADSASALLVFFIITSAILHADDANLLGLKDSNRDQARQRCGGVKFAPLYAMLVRTVQLTVCASSMGAFRFRTCVGLLAMIVAVCTGAALLPFCRCIFPNDICSFAALAPLRSAGFASVAWTALVCIVRASRSDDDLRGVWQHEATVYIGWGIAFIVASVASLVIEVVRFRRWKDLVQTSGLAAAVENLLNVFESALVSNVVLGYKATLANSSNSVTDGAVGSVVATSTIVPALGKSVSTLRKEMYAARSPRQQGQLLIEIEDIIMVDRLSQSFLSDRRGWVEALEDLHDESELELFLPYGVTEGAAALESVVDRCRRLSLEAAEETGPMSTMQFAAPVPAVPAVPAVHGDHTPSAAPTSFSILLNRIEELHNGLAPEPMTTDISRTVFTILLTNKRMPTELCWLIFDYLMETKHLRAILLLPSDALYARISNPLDPLHAIASAATYSPDGSRQRDTEQDSRGGLTKKVNKYSMYTDETLLASMRLLYYRHDLIRMSHLCSESGMSGTGGHE